MSVGSARRPVKGMDAYEYMLDTPLAMTDKLKRDFDRLIQDKSKLADLAYNLAVSAWRLTDWVWRFDEILRPGINTRFGCDNLAAFQADIRSKSPSLGLCADVANGSKHFVMGSENQRKLVPTGDKRQSTENDDRAPLSLSAVLTGSGSGLALPTSVLAITRADGAFDRAEEVFESALEFWLDFLKFHGLISAKPSYRRRSRRTT